MKPSSKDSTRKKKFNTKTNEANKMIDATLLKKKRITRKHKVY